MILHDGQNLFDSHTSFAGVPWGCDETAEQLTRRGLLQPIIQVGVGNTPDRLKEYGPCRHHEHHAENYARFLMEELQPMLARTYRIAPGPRNTGVCGSSMGGLITLHLCREYHEVFGVCAALSPSLWWDDQGLLHDIEHHGLRGLKHCKVWFDMGEAEGHDENGQVNNVRRAQRLVELFKEAHHPAFCYLQVAHGQHDESAWAARYGDVLRYCWPTDS
jgi:predicted alpha/beta superfamily hydrolase